ncbi:organic cation transporter protein [Fopius arisanus]|uniref:Organic cation transporter protein n=2 Tax=Fopius arisanus TaxID=64838 RepID=A0A9R1TN84_9HYME|nr:PREDICTED: organic cation transporter protein-like [Fopius arisanus]
MTEVIKRDYEPLDTIQEAMGVMGPWQIIITVALSLVNFPVAWHQLSIVFLAPPANFTCINPTPVDNKTVYSTEDTQCFVNVTLLTSSNITELGSPVKCTQFEYDKSVFDSTIITEWDLICDRQQLANIAQSCTMFGILVGNMVFSMMADRIGRKIPLMIAVVVQSVTGLLSTFSPWFELFVLCKFVAAIATGGTMLISFVLLMEVVGIEWRSTLSVLFHIPFLLGHLLIPLIAYYTRGWRIFLMTVSLPPILLLSYYWVIPESPRWLLAVGRIKSARNVLKTAAKRNSIHEDKVIAAIESHSNQRGKEVELDKKFSKTYNLLDICRTPNMRIRSICIAVNWFVCGICFFGLAQYVGRLEGDIFINVAVSAACELPGILVVLYLISRVSRLKILIGANVTSGVSLLLLMFISNKTAQVVLATIGLSAMSISFPTIYLYTGELFPTVVRNIGFGLCSVSARIGSIIAPFIATMGYYGASIPPLCFGIGPLIGAGLCLLLPETMDCKLPETIEEAENFRKGKTDIALEVVT